MAMNATQVALNIKGVNKTGHVFREIAATGARVSKSVAMVGSAAFAVTAAALAATAKQLGELSDQAMRAGTSTDELTKLSAALDVLGVKSNSPDMLASAFQKMAKSIGENGVAGFEKTVAAIAKMETQEERATAAMAVFGKSGLEFMPVIEAAAQNGVGALQEVINAMPGISQAAADSGDDVADSMGLMTKKAKSLWAEAVGQICAKIGQEFPGGVREAALKANAYMEYYAKVSLRTCVASFENISKAYKAVSADWGETFGQLWDALAGGFKAWYKFLWEELKNVGAVIRDFVKECWNGLKGDGFEWSNVVKNADFANVSKQFAKEFSTAINSMTIFDGVNWSNVETGDLQKTLQDQLTSAATAAAAVSSAAVSGAGKKSAEETADKIQTAIRNARNEFMKEGSYKAATLSMRADYGASSDKTVKAIDKLRNPVEKIEKSSDKIAAAMASVGTV